MDQSMSLTGNLIPNQASGTQIKHSKGAATLDLDQYTFKSMHTEFSIIIILNVLKWEVHMQDIIFNVFSKKSMQTFFARTFAYLKSSVTNLLRGNRPIITQII